MRFWSVVVLFMVVGSAAAQPVTWQARVEPAAEVASEGFGYGVALEDAWALVGEPFSGVEPGQVAFYAQTGGAWSEAGILRAADARPGDTFGQSVALSGTYAVVGAPVRDETGVVYVFEHDGTAWQQVARLTPSDGDAGDQFGTDVALWNGVAVVGAPLADVGGAAYVYERDPLSGVWEEAARLEGSTLTGGDLFGWSVDVYDGRVLVGAQYADGFTGRAYVYERDGNAWTETTILTASDASAGDRFGRSVALGSDHALIGAPLADDGAGAAYAFKTDGSAWTETQRLVPTGDRGFDTFSWQLDLAENTAVFGAPYRQSQTGAAYTFDRDPETGQWTQAAFLEDAEAVERDQVGWQVAADPGQALVGVPRAGLGVGRSLLFEADAGTWTEVARFGGTGTQPITGAVVPCTDGLAGAFPCEDIDLMAFLPNSDLGAGPGVRLNDIWGWTDPETGAEVALVGREDGTSFVDVSDPLNPVYLGSLPTHADAAPNTWRDVKTYRNYAFVVADGSSNFAHGMQVFDLTELRGVTRPQTFAETAQYDGFGNAHNVFVNEATGYAYAVGTNTCGGGLHMIDVREPLQPVFAGCFADVSTGRSGTGYTHDVQCVLYQGPDEGFRGREICFSSNETAVSIADVTDKQNPLALSTATYPMASYVHQGWLTEDHRYFIQGDELDETGFDFNTRTFIWDVSDLEDPRLVTEYVGPTTAIDHNLYTRGSFVFQSNYTAGLRILDISDIENPEEVAFFDTVPTTDEASFDGSWSNYPYFDSGIIILTSRREGLFVVRPTTVPVAVAPAEQPAEAPVLRVYPNPARAQATVELTLPAPQPVRVALYDVLGREVMVLHDGVLPAATQRLHLDVPATLPRGTYLLRVTGATAQTRAVTIL